MDAGAMPQKYLCPASSEVKSIQQNTPAMQKNRILKLFHTFS